MTGAQTFAFVANGVLALRADDRPRFQRRLQFQPQMLMFPCGSGMVLVVAFRQPPKTHVSINLGRADIGVPQDRLYSAKVRAAFQEMCGTTVA
jgi:hypothetical protein